MWQRLSRWWPWCYSHSVWLCGFYYGAFHAESCLALCSCVFQSCLTLLSPRLRKRELVYVLLVLYLFIVQVLFLSLFVTGVSCGLWLWHSLDFYINVFFNIVTVSLPGASTFETPACAPSEDSAQPGRNPPSLIRVFSVRMKKAWVLSYPLSAQRRLWSDWADVQFRFE